MTQAAASYREDVEQLRRRFEEFRSTHAVRSRPPDELWAAEAKLARRDGIETAARTLDVDRPNLQKWTDRFELQRKQDRAGLHGGVSLAEETTQRPPLWNCWRKLQERQRVAWWK